MNLLGKHAAEREINQSPVEETINRESARRQGTMRVVAWAAGATNLEAVSVFERDRGFEKLSECLATTVPTGVISSAMAEVQQSDFN
mmetsp:Transcript_3520/g.22152  ORF Transcript_3520/g.22152 Transcript_3520/m.22152 type:complete len:87 (+) Transcript_3520:216-476(+)